MIKKVGQFLQRFLRQVKFVFLVISEPKDDAQHTPQDKSVKGLRQNHRPRSLKQPPLIIRVGGDVMFIMLILGWIALLVLAASSGGLNHID